MREIIHSDEYCTSLEELVPLEDLREELQEGIDWLLSREPDSGIVVHDGSNPSPITVRAITVLVRDAGEALVFFYRENSSIVLADFALLPDF